MIQTPTQTRRITPEELAAFVNTQNEYPADTRERLRVALGRLPEAARAVYNRDNIRSPQTPFDTIVETVLYHFDEGNRTSVATRLRLSYTELTTLLIGYLLGRGE